MINLYKIEAGSLSIAGVASHNYWALFEGEGGIIAEPHGLAVDRKTGAETIGIIDDSLRAHSYDASPLWL